MKLLRALKFSSYRSSRLFMKFIPMGFIFSAELAAITNEIGTPHIFNWLCDFRQITHPF